jgi:outer membrane protein assembly factor BamB
VGLPGIFINYRREDSGGYAPQIYQALRLHFGKSLVFMDIDTIRDGEDYRAAIQQAIGQSEVFLAVIGRSWLHATDDKGNRRIEQPRDLVRAEIAQALNAKIHVVPVLVGHAPMPSADTLPDDLRPLAYRNAHDLPDHFFQQSLRELIRAVDPYVLGKRELSRRRLMWAGGTSFAVLLIGAVVRQMVHPNSTGPSTAGSSADLIHAGPFDSQIDESAKQPAVIVRKETNASALPTGIPGPWKIDRLDFAAAVNGPHHSPGVSWISRVSLGDAWKLIGFAPDRTVFLFDWERNAVCGLKDGHEQWAFPATGVDGITPQGLICVEGSALGALQGEFQCFNSRGDGGLFRRPMRKPWNLISWSEWSSAKAPGECEGGVLTLNANNASIPLDGNCRHWEPKQDEQGRIYVGSDRNTLYCFNAAGTLLWSYKAEAEIADAPLFSLGDAVFAIKDNLVCVRDGVRRWSTKLESCEAHLIDKSGVIYVTCKGDPIHDAVAAIDHDGKLLWKLQVAGKPQAIDPQGQLYIMGNSSSWLMCLA